MRYLIFLITLFLCTNVYAVKVTDLTEDASPGTDSLLITVDDPSGTAATRKTTIANVLTDGNIPNDITIDTATALAANGANCSAGNAPLGVDASGAVEGCFDVWTEAENTAAGYISSQTDDQTLAEVLAEGADANDVSITSLAKLEGVDSAVYVDMSADGNTDVVADVNIDLNSPTITFANATKPVKSIYLSAAGATTPISDYAELNDFTGTNFTYRVLAFDKDSDEKCFWSFPIPDNLTGTTVTFTYYWTTDSGGAAETVRWAVDTGGYANDEAWKTGALGGTLQTTDDTWIADGDLHIVTSAAMTTGWTAGDMATVYLYRDVSGDDLGGDIYLIGVKIEYPIGTISQ